jgi:PEGA domain-containing protein
MTRPRIGRGILLTILLACPTAFAQAPTPAATPAAPAALSETLQGGAKQAYEAAKLLATNRDFAGALAEFGQAYTASKDPRLLFNMAICEKELHRYARMKSTLEQFLREGGTAMTSETRATVDEALSAIRPLVASVRLTVSEAGATVSVDGDDVGTTPLAAPIMVELGRHQLSVKKAGFVTLEPTIETPGGSEAVLSLSMVADRHVAQLVVSAEPESMIVVDGKTASQGRFDGSVATGTHTIVVTAPGKRAYKADLDLRDGETRSLQVTLEADAHGGSVWPWIVGGAILAAGAATGGYFLFKPQDQTTPLPQGKLATVQLTLWKP